MRGKKAAINTAFSLTEELISVICGFILPRLILSAFGSRYNGLTTSISQFLSCAILLRSGIGGATRAALYKPLADEDHNEINAIVKATDIFMKRIGLLLAGMIVVFAIVYPFFVRNEFDWLFTFSLFLIIGASTFAESFFGITYLIVLQADQRVWISSMLKSMCYILNTLIASVLILNGAGIHLVKSGSALIYIAYPIVMGAYVRKRYRIDTHVEPDNKAISQRWDAFWQQVAIFVMNNTDVMVLTVCSNMLEVSVYSVYNMVIHGLKRLIVAFSGGMEAAFGNMIAKGEEKALAENVGVVETIFYSVATVLYSCTAILILDFVRLYTVNINDVNYIRPLFAFTIITANFFNAVRIPYQLVVQAAGHYKQTKTGAIIEPVLNITLSVIFVFKLGLTGVAIGTLAATVFRTVQYSIYMNKNLVRRSNFLTIKRIATAMTECAIIVALMRIIDFPAPENYFVWFLHAVVVAVICVIVVVASSFVVFRRDTKIAVNKLLAVVKKR